MESNQENAALRLIGRLESSIGNGDAKVSAYLSALRDEIQKSERSSEASKEKLAQFEEAYEKLTSPANRVGIFLRHLADGQVLFILGDQEYVSLIDPILSDVDSLVPGVRVRLNEAYAVIGIMPESDFGNIVKVSQVLDDNRLRIGADSQNQQGRLILRSSGLIDLTIKAGDEVRLDASGRIAIEHFVQQSTQEYFVEEVPQTPWSSVGGQEEAIAVIKETVEQPMLYPEIYAKFGKKPVKGILLYGPPGCGKTLLGKAVAYNLAKDYSERNGVEAKECFLHISGPKILNMWLGETERMVREIFATARERAKEGQIVVIFVDEAESVLRTRSSGRWLNISNTVVPQFCAEMDGLVEMENVVVILTSNRPDYIDPAILRPERIDRKVRIKRPNFESSKDILSIYLDNSVPVDPAFAKESDGEACARKAMVEGAIAHLWRKTKETEFLKVAFRSGESETLYWSDLVSGALLKSVVDRAKDYAIHRAIADPNNDHGLNLEDIKSALQKEYAENEIFPKSDAVDDWLKLLDYDREDVISVKPVGIGKGESIINRSVI